MFAHFLTSDFVIYAKYNIAISGIGLKKVGDEAIPNPSLGKWSKRNAEGYSYPDRTKDKIRRYVCSRYMHPWGKIEIPEVLVDFYKDCYPRVEVPANELRICLEEDSDGELYIVSHLNNKNTEYDLLVGINLFVEIFGYCELDKSLETKKIDKEMVNWDILPPGIMPSEQIKENIKTIVSEKRKNIYDDKFAKFVEKYPVKMACVGLNGYLGYYAYIFEKICVFESACYGNATYIVNSTDWEETSKKTKKQIKDEGLLLELIIHTTKWEENFDSSYRRFELRE